RNHRTRYDGRDQRRVLTLIDYAMRQTEQGGNGSKRQSRGHQQRRVHGFLVGRSEKLRDWIDAYDLGGDLYDEKQNKRGRRGYERGYGNKGAGTNEIEGSQQSECQRAQPPHQCVVLADG